MQSLCNLSICNFYGIRSLESCAVLEKRIILYACCSFCLECSFLFPAWLAPSFLSGLCSLSHYQKDLPQSLLPTLVPSTGSLLKSTLHFSISLATWHYCICYLVSFSSKLNISPTHQQLCLCPLMYFQPLNTAWHFKNVY